jgi:hypothetical protein
MYRKEILEALDSLKDKIEPVIRQIDAEHIPDEWKPLYWTRFIDWFLPLYEKQMTDEKFVEHQRNALNYLTLVLESIIVLPEKVKISEAQEEK